MSVATADLRAELEPILAPRRIAALDRRPCAYRTSFELDELDVHLEDGAELRIMFKNVGRDALDAGALKAKPAFMHDPLREIEVYRSVLSKAGLGTPELYGAVADPGRDAYWLFMENVVGAALWQIGELEVWEATAGWLARLHFGLDGDLGGAAPHLIRYDAAFYSSWVERALDFARRPETPWSTETRNSVEWLAVRYEPVVERLAREPATFVHGELYPSNVLVQGGPRNPRICPIDWEIAALGPGLVDLAALVSGWGPEEHAALARAYCREASTFGVVLDERELLEKLRFFRLHLAVQWVGWEPSWTPPAEHRRDWLAEALELARQLGL